MQTTRYTARCVDCGGACSRRAKRCRSCQEKFRWRDPADPRRVPRYGLQPGDALWPVCGCGCGEPVPARKAGCQSRGYVKGEPCKYVSGHSARVRRKLAKDGMFSCSKCGATKPVAEFHADSNRPSGLAPRCKACESVRHRKPNPKYRKWVSARARERATASAYRARKKNAFVEHVDPFVVFERDGGVCGICGDPADRDDFHVDHVVPLSRGGEHSYANTQVAHPACNMVKHNRLPQEAWDGDGSNHRPSR